MRKIKKRKKKFLSIYLFFFIFMPPIIPSINILYVLDAVAFISLFFKYRKECNIVKKNRNISFFIRSFSFFSLYAVCRNFIDWIFVNRLENSEYLVNIYRLLGVGFLLNICAIYIVCFCIHYFIDVKELCYCIVNAGILEGFFTIIMLLSPTIKKFLNNLFVLNVYGSWENANIPSWSIEERLYGFANVLYDGFGYGTGIIAGIALFILFQDKVTFRKIINFIILLIVPTVNSITGLFIALLAFVVKSGQVLKKNRVKTSSCVLVIFLFILGGIGFIVLGYVAPASIERIQNNILAILGRSEKVTSFGNLTSHSFWIMPDSLMGKIFGTGHSVYTTTQFIHSDTGYTNMIWMVGISGCAWLYYTFIYPLYRVYKETTDIFLKIIMCFLVFSFMFFEIKGIGVAINTGIPIIITVMYMASINNKNTSMLYAKM
ncbi:MAG: hypothetical protein MR392_04275 [Roseburia sp.]|nr:hypothetical protein [Roseburia sp.]